MQVYPFFLSPPLLRLISVLIFFFFFSSLILSSPVVALICILALVTSCQRRDNKTVKITQIIKLLIPLVPIARLVNMSLIGPNYFLEVFFFFFFFT